MIDYSALLYDPVYAEIGVPATFTSGMLEIALTVIDDTRPKTLQAGSLEVKSVGPGAYARIPELEANGITRADWQDAVLSFNGQSWVVRSWELRGSPNGENKGEVRFSLKLTVSVEVPDNGNGNSDGTGWRTLKLGAGGQLTWIDVADDGTMLSIPDIHGLYVWDWTLPNTGNDSATRSFGTWRQAVNAVSISHAAALTKENHGT